MAEIKITIEKTIAYVKISESCHCCGQGQIVKEYDLNQGNFAMLDRFKEIWDELTGNTLEEDLKLLHKIENKS